MKHQASSNKITSAACNVGNGEQVLGLRVHQAETLWLREALALGRWQSGSARAA